MRIVSLLASGTEIVCALGAGEALVGRSHECDNPAWVRRLPACIRPAFDVTSSSRVIDAAVRRRLKAQEPLYIIDADLIERLQPDVLITQIHCDVCAVTPDDVMRAGFAVQAAQVVSLSAGSVTGIYDGIRTIARALDRAQAGDALIADMQQRMERVRASVRGAPTPTVVLLEWADPVFAAGNWSPELVEATKTASCSRSPPQTATPVAQFPQAAHAFHPAEDLFNAFAEPLTDRVAAMPGRSAINRACRFLGYVRRHTQIAHGVYPRPACSD